MTTRRRRSPREHAGLARRAAGVVASVVLASIAAALLAGCTSEPADEPAPEAPQAARWAGRSDRTPIAGECWQEPDYELAGTWWWWQGSSPVDCASEHNSITVAVGELPEDFPAPPSDPGEEPHLTDEQLGIVHHVCAEGTGADIGLREGTRARWFWYLPSPREWEAGERWVRCDVAIVALGPLFPTVVEPLERDIAGIVGDAWDAFAYRLCIDTPYPAPDHQPWDDYATNVAVSCDDGRGQWHFGGSTTFDGAAPPTQEEALDRVQPGCLELIGLLGRTSAVIYYPNEQTWAQGKRTATCWIY